MTTEETEGPKPPPVPAAAASRAWQGFGEHPSAPARPAAPSRPVAPPPAEVPTRRPRRNLVTALVAVGAVIVVVSAVFAVTGDEKPQGEKAAEREASGSVLGNPPPSAAVTNAPRIATNADEAKNRFPLVAAQLAPLDVTPAKPAPDVIPSPIELPVENTANGWQFGVQQTFSARGIDPNRPSDAPPGTSAYIAVLIDGFAAPEGAHAMREEYVKVRAANGYTIVSPGDTTTPTRLHRDTNGLVTTTLVYASTNMLVQLVNVCRLCSLGDIDRALLPVLAVLQNQFPPP